MLNEIPEFDLYYVAYFERRSCKRTRSLQATVRRECSPRQHIRLAEQRLILSFEKSVERNTSG